MKCNVILTHSDSVRIHYFSALLIIILKRRKDIFLNCPQFSAQKAGNHILGLRNFSRGAFPRPPRKRGPHVATFYKILLIQSVPLFKAVGYLNIYWIYQLGVCLFWPPFSKCPDPITSSLKPCCCFFQQTLTKVQLSVTCLLFNKRLQFCPRSLC